MLVFSIIAAIVGFILLPNGPNSMAGNEEHGDGLVTMSRSEDDKLPNYDIRTDKTAYEKLASFRTNLGRDASATADVRDDFARAAAKLKAKVPTLKVEYNQDLRIPEVIAPDVTMGRAFLTSSSKEKHSLMLADFLKANKELVGASERQIDELKLFSEYTNPDGNLSYVEYDQEINGIPVFRGEVKAAFTKKGELIRVINNFAPGLEYSSLSTDFKDAVDALRSAAKYIDHELTDSEQTRDAARSDSNRIVFGEGEWSPTAEKIYFPTEPGVAVPAWRVLIWQPSNAFYLIVDADTGSLLWRKNMTEDQAQPATYNVYANSNAMINVADSPAPGSPFITSPLTGTQGSIISRAHITRVGAEAPYGFNSLGWIADGNNSTDGNNVESGLDLVTPDGIDFGTQATGDPFRNFVSTWNPPPGSPGPGDIPQLAAARRGAVIQQFYILNLYHDELYRLGFTESAKNFQDNNFGRGGVGSDRISAEGQDFSGNNNANFGTGPDGTRGKMQMYTWTGSDPDRDGTGEAQIILHEVSHGTSNRLHGNAGGLSTNMARAMGEGWSDFYSHALLSEPGDPLNGIYPLSGYLLYQSFSVGTQNYYYGIRRFPKAIMSATGGPQNKPFNPLTFADIDQSKINTADGAFPAMTGNHISTNADQTHAAGEVWSSSLWEVRGKMVERLGWDVGNRRILQLVTDGMKMSPLNPTFLQARDSILAAAFGSATTADQVKDGADVWAGFAIRGMGVSASIQNAGTGTGDTRVTEAFDQPNLLQLPTFIYSDSLGDSDGVAEPGETILITIPLTNASGQTANGATGQLVGGSSASYGTIASTETASRQVSYAIPQNTPCGSSLNITFNVTSSLGPTSFVIPIPIGSLNLTYTENFDGVNSPFFPNGWTVTNVSGGQDWISASNKSDTAPNSAFAADPSTVGGGSDLTSPLIPITSSTAQLSFRNNYDTESGWDGGALEISINSGAFQDILAAGGTFIAGGYNGTLGGGANNPLANRQAWSGNSGGWILTQIQLPASANGHNIQLRFRFGADNNTALLGWNVDTIRIFAAASCQFSQTQRKARADFDGDGKSDLSVFRPSDGNWYLKQSTGGFWARTWGIATDQPTPGDFDGDGKTDIAVFRPNTDNASTDPDFYMVQSNGFVYRAESWGDPGDKAVIGDYDGDGKDDVAVFRPTTADWYTIKSSGGTDITNYGLPGDIPVPGRYDADAKTDRAVYRNGQWIVAQSSGGTMTAFWGQSGDMPVPADYDGDQRDDVAVWRPSDGIWYVRRSTNFQFDLTGWGQSGDLPVPGDYDGDGKTDLAIYRGGTWWLKMSSTGIAALDWGIPGDIPIPSRYIPF